MHVQKKVESSVKVATKKKKPVPKLVDVASRPFTDHLVIDVAFLREHALEQMVELLEKQGVDKLFLVNCTLNKELAR